MKNDKKDEGVKPADEDVTEIKVGEIADWFKKNEIGKVPTDITYTDPATGKKVKVNLEASVIPGSFKAELQERAVKTDDSTGDMSFDKDKYDEIMVGMTFHFTDEQIEDIKKNKPLGVWDALIIAAMRINSMYIPKRKAEAIKN